MTTSRTATPTKNKAVRSRRNLCHFLRRLERWLTGWIVRQRRPRSKLVFYTAFRGDLRQKDCYPERGDPFV